jgi:hypothetical protein
MKNQEKLDFAIAKIKAVKGNLSAKRDRIKYYTESLELGRFDNIDIERLESFDFEKEVLNRQLAIESYRESKKKLA